MRLNGARAICQSLVEEGVSTIFGLPGGAIMPLYDVLPEFTQLRHILVRHEQCAGHMADGYARAAAAIKKPQRLRANYHKNCGVRQFHACYSVGDDKLWGVVRAKKGIDNSLAAIKSCRAARPDGEMIYVILDNLSAHKGKKIKAWCTKNNVELCFTPTYSSWANPIECHFGPLRDFVLNNSDHRNHTVLTKRLHAYLHWRNDHASDPGLRERLRRERARLRSERQRRWGRPAQQPAAAAA